MTLVQYATVYQSEPTDRVLLARGRCEKTQEMMRESPDGAQEIVRMHRVDVLELPEPMSPTEYQHWSEEHSEEILDNYAPLEPDMSLDLLTMKGMEGERVEVTPTVDHVEEDRIEAYVDQDGIVRQLTNGAAFNENTYMIADDS